MCVCVCVCLLVGGSTGINEGKDGAKGRRKLLSSLKS